jgi:hypothetical protein
MSNRTRATRNPVPVLVAALACLVGSSSPGQAFTYYIPTFPKDKPACFAIGVQLSDIRLDTATIMRDPALAAGAKADTFGWTAERVVAAFNEEIAALIARVPGAAPVFGPQCMSRMSLARANLLAIQFVVRRYPQCDRGPLPTPAQEERCFYKADMYQFWCGAGGCTSLLPSEAMAQFSLGGKPLDARDEIRRTVAGLEQHFRGVVR